MNNDETNGDLNNLCNKTAAERTGRRNMATARAATEDDDEDLYPKHPKMKPNDSLATTNQLLKDKADLRRHTTTATEKVMNIKVRADCMNQFQVSKTLYKGGLLSEEQDKQCIADIKKDLVLSD